MRRPLLVYTTFALVTIFVAADMFGPLTDEERELIAEAVIWNLLYPGGEDGTTARPNEETLFILVEGVDPPPAFLERFRNVGPPIRPGSEFKEGEGVLILAEKIKKVGFRRARAEGSQFRHGLNAGGATFIVKKIGGTWEVVETDAGWQA
jgi:hypothetical protein